MTNSPPTILEKLARSRALIINNNVYAPWDRGAPSSAILENVNISAESMLRPLLELSESRADSTWRAFSKLDALLSASVGPLPDFAGLAASPIFMPAMTQARTGAGSVLGRLARGDLATNLSQRSAQAAATGSLRAAALVCNNARSSLAAMGLTPSQVAALEVHAFSEAAAGLIMDAAIELQANQSSTSTFLVSMGKGGLKLGLDLGSDALNFEAVFGVIGRATYASNFATQELENVQRNRQYEARTKLQLNPHGNSGEAPDAIDTFPPLRELALAFSWLASVWRFEPESGLNLGRAHVLKAGCDFALAHASISTSVLPSDVAALGSLLSHAEAAVLHASPPNPSTEGFARTTGRLRT